MSGGVPNSACCEMGEAWGEGECLGEGEGWGAYRTRPAARWVRLGVRVSVWVRVRAGARTELGLLRDGDGLLEVLEHRHVGELGERVEDARLDLWKAGGKMGVKIGCD
jgi:hypothetical protein